MCCLLNAEISPTSTNISCNYFLMKKLQIGMKNFLVSVSTLRLVALFDERINYGKQFVQCHCVCPCVSVCGHKQCPKWRRKVTPKKQKPVPPPTLPLQLINYNNATRERARCLHKLKTRIRPVACHTPAATRARCQLK